MKWLLILLASASWAGAAERGWKITGPEREQAIYAGRPVKLEAWVAAEKGSATSAVVRVEAWQAGGEIAAPLRESTKQNIRINLGTTNRIEIPWTSPDLRGRSSFVLRFSTESGRAMGAITVTAYPTNLVEEFADLLAVEPVRLVNPPKPVEEWFADVATKRDGSRLNKPYGTTLRWVGSRRSSSVGIAEPQGVELIRTAPPSSSTVKHDGQPWVTVDPGLFLRLDQDPEALLQLMDLLRRSSQFDASRQIKTE